MLLVVYRVACLVVDVYARTTLYTGWQALADGTATRAIPQLFDGDAPRPGAGGIFPGM